MQMSWLKKLLSTDRRKRDRIRLPGLVAHYWTGAAPRAQDVLDISPTGTFLLTQERWYLGTVIKITLQSSDGTGHAASSKRTVELMAQVVRSAPNGVGLRFIFPGAEAGTNPTGNTSVCADRKSLDEFIARAKTSQDDLVFAVE